MDFPPDIKFLREFAIKKKRRRKAVPKQYTLIESIVSELNDAPLF